MDTSQLTDEELTYHLLTPDGKGKKLKQECLNLLISRARIQASPVVRNRWPTQNYENT